MTYVKAVVVGVVTALLAAALWIVGNLFLPMIRSRAFSGSGGIGGVSVSSESGTPVMVIGFIVGFAWTIWRSRRRQSLSS